MRTKSMFCAVTITAAVSTTLAAALLLSASLVAPAHAASKTIDMAALRKMVSGLGLEDIGDGKTFVKVENQGSRSLTIDYQPSTDGSDVLVYAPLAAVPDDRMAAMPAAKMLAYNDGHLACFTLGGDDAHTIYLAYRIPAAAVTPQSLRAATDAVLAEADEAADLWNSDKWTAGKAASTTLWGSGTSTDAEVAPVPFGVGNVMFTATDTDGFSAYQKRPSSVFTPDEKMFTYVEFTGLTYRPDGDGFKSAIKITASVRASNGTMLLSDANVGTITNNKHAKVREVYAGLSFRVNGIAPGEYVLIYKLQDVEGGATATTEQSFSIAAAAASR